MPTVDEIRSKDCVDPIEADNLDGTDYAKAVITSMTPHDVHTACVIQWQIVKRLLREHTPQELIEISKHHTIIAYFKSLALKEMYNHGTITYAQWICICACNHCALCAFYYNKGCFWCPLQTCSLRDRSIWTQILIAMTIFLERTENGYNVTLDDTYKVIDKLIDTVEDYDKRGE